MAREQVSCYHAYCSTPLLPSSISLLVFSKIMLGTNDAKDPGDHGPNNWLHNCGGPDHTTLDGCSYASDYHDMIEVVKGLGTTPTGPKIFTAIPPPLMAQYSIGANQTVINSVYPKLVPMINTVSILGMQIGCAFTTQHIDYISFFRFVCTVCVGQQCWYDPYRRLSRHGWRCRLERHVPPELHPRHC